MDCAAADGGSSIMNYMVHVRKLVLVAVIPVSDSH